MKSTQENSLISSVPSDNYQDYVIKNKRLVGQFDDMYRHAAEIPWHQDKTANAIFSDLTITLLRRRHPHSLLDVGCGLGYMTARLKHEIPGLTRVVGLDVSETAVIKARARFPEIEFCAGTINTDLWGGERFDVVVSKDVLWYVLDDLPGYLSALYNRSSQWIYIGQSFPEARPFYGDDVLPDAFSLLTWLKNHNHQIDYSIVERDTAYGDREYAHILINASS